MPQFVFPVPAGCGTSRNSLSKRLPWVSRGGFHNLLAQENTNCNTPPDQTSHAAHAVFARAGGRTRRGRAPHTIVYGLRRGCGGCVGAAACSPIQPPPVGLSCRGLYHNSYFHVRAANGARQNAVVHSCKHSGSYFDRHGRPIKTHPRGTQGFHGCT